MYSIPEPVNIDVNIFQDIRSYRDKERPWCPPLIKQTGRTVLECLQALFFLQAKNMLRICKKKKIFSHYAISTEMSFGNMFLMVS